MVPQLWNGEGEKSHLNKDLSSPKIPRSVTSDSTMVVSTYYKLLSMIMISKSLSNAVTLEMTRKLEASKLAPNWSRHMEQARLMVSAWPWLVSRSTMNKSKVRVDPWEAKTALKT